MEFPAKAEQLAKGPATGAFKRSSATIWVMACAALVGALAVATYAAWIHNYLVADSWTVIDAVSDPSLSLADLLPFRESPLRTSATYYYAPVLATLLWAVHKVGGYSPEWYNVVLILLHAGTSLFLFAAVLQLTGSRLKATAAGAVFATHFAATEAVGWFGAITHPTAGFFGAAAMALYSRYLVTRRPVWRVAAMLALVAGALSQSTGLPWFAVLALLDILYSRRAGTTRGLARRMAVLALPLLFVLPPQIQAFRFAQGGYHYELGPWVVLNVLYYPLSTVIPSLEQSAVSLWRDLFLAPADWSALTRLMGMREAFNLIFAATLAILFITIVWAKGSWLTRFALVAFGISLTPFLLINGQGYRYLYTPLVFFSIVAADVTVDCYRFLRTSSRPAAWAVALIIPLFVTLSFAEAQRQLFWWQQAGFVAHQSLHHLKELQPQFPAGAKIVFGGLPDTLQNTNAEVWRQGITEAVRTVYGDRTLRIEAYGKKEVERLFSEELRDDPNTYGFVWEDWRFKKVAP